MCGVCVCACLSARVCALCMYMTAYMHIQKHVCTVYVMYTNTDTYVYVCVHTFAYIRVCTYIYIYIYIYFMYVLTEVRAHGCMQTMQTKHTPQLAHATNQHMRSIIQKENPINEEAEPTHHGPLTPTPYIHCDTAIRGMSKTVTPRINSHGRVPDAGPMLLPVLHAKDLQRRLKPQTPFPETQVYPQVQLEI